MKTILQFVRYVKTALVGLVTTGVVMGGAFYAIAAIKTPSYLLVVLFLLVIVWSNVVAASARSLF